MRQSLARSSSTSLQIPRGAPSYSRSEAMELSWDPDFARRKALADEALALARSAGDKGRLGGSAPAEPFYGDLVSRDA